LTRKTAGIVDVMLYEGLIKGTDDGRHGYMGAGASKAEGAPLQGELFKEYFASHLYTDARSHMNRELTAFFRDMFGIDVKRKNLTNDMFPTFEEVLGLTDLAIMRKEAFRRFDIAA
jgi:hypothetical protein